MRITKACTLHPYPSSWIAEFAFLPAEYQKDSAIAQALLDVLRTVDAEYVCGLDVLGRLPRTRAMLAQASAPLLPVMDNVYTGCVHIHWEDEFGLIPVGAITWRGGEVYITC